MEIEKPVGWLSECGSEVVDLASSLEEGIDRSEPSEESSAARLDHQEFACDIACDPGCYFVTGKQTAEEK